MTPPTRAGVLAGGLIALALLVGCSGADQAAPDAQPTAAATPEPAEADPSAAPSEDEQETATADEVTCETLVSPGVVENFAAVGWTAKQEPFRAGVTEVEGGLLCTWADFDSGTGGDLQSFGWAPIDAAQAQQAQHYLLAQGWIREQGDDGVYITESPGTIIAPDENGYGVTYLFGDGWVEQADTKQGLLLITAPQ